MCSNSKKAEKIKKRLQKVITDSDLTQHRKWVEQCCAELELSPWLCAAAFLQMGQPHLFTAPRHDFKVPKPSPHKLAPLRTIHYRLNVGSEHSVTMDQIKDILVEESGVDRRHIGKVEIRSQYTLVELPEGMPSDIFQLLAEVELAERKLNIKRIKPNRKKNRNRRPLSSSE